MDLMSTAQLLGNFGEFFGAIAVFVTLVYLAAQIRQNTRSLKSASYQAAISSMSEMARAAGTDVDVARVVRVFMQGDVSDLNEDEYVMVTSYMTGLFRNFENFYYQYQTGAMEDHLWMGMRNSMVGYIHMPNVRAWWDQRRVIFSSQFAEFLESQEQDHSLQIPRAPAHHA